MVRIFCSALKTPRFPYHLIKYKKNNPDYLKNLAICPLSAYHPLAEIRHISSCDDKSCIEQGITSEKIIWTKHDLPFEAVSVQLAQRHRGIHHACAMSLVPSPSSQDLPPTHHHPTANTMYQNLALPPDEMPNSSIKERRARENTFAPLLKVGPEGKKVQRTELFKGRTFPFIQAYHTALASAAFKATVGETPVFVEQRKSYRWADCNGEGERGRQNPSLGLNKDNAIRGEEGPGKEASHCSPLPRIALPSMDDPLTLLSLLATVTKPGGRGRECSSTAQAYNSRELVQGGRPRLEVKDKTDEVHLLNDTLASEQKKCRELQWALEKEKAKQGRSEERDKEELEKQQLNESQQKMESQRALHDAQLAEEQGRNLELQVLLESEKVRIREMSSTLDRERELHAQLQSSDDSGQPRPSLPSEDLLKELQKQLEEKHSRIVELLNETEKYKLDSLQTRQQMEKDRQVHRKTLQTEQEANTEGQKKMHELQSKVEDLQRQLEEKRQQVYKLDLEGKRLQGIMQEFQKQELEREEKRESRRILYQNLNEPTLMSPGTSCGSLTERLLRQNTELMGHISQLTEEKNDLRNMLMKLEEQISGGPNIEAIITSEKEVWNREKLALQKSLKRAEAEVYKLKAELRNEALLQNLSPDSEHATLKRIYGKYLRAESFRKALIYQKKYLLLLLGGFQECEEATLALLARMGGQPAFTDLEVITNRPKGFTRFRSAVRVSMAISR
ncbi:hypothetical protein Celaphus_00011851 [Cervus elaphus hippelaphus]|uniref:Pericentrin/AKAP-450 centrosomal targeting domain-containing protein n=1 Tax=Cervus elaphus hippelaphus TaxID=46360 RepID=A0A212CK46_CEREH|nr:hypothetical protein Celaphus_00011851 [Cervus elaphus hippelaphus]